MSSITDQEKLWMNHMIVHLDVCPTCKEQFVVIMKHVQDNFEKDDRYFCEGEVPEY